jgi:integrase
VAKVRVRPETGTLYLDFFFQGRRCREQTSLPDNSDNRKKLRKILGRIEAEITLGTFDYVRYFPNSRLATRFAPHSGSAPVAPPTLGERADALASVRTPAFRDFAQEWYAQHEIEWRRSYRPTVQGALDQHLIPRFGEIDVGRITKEDILNFRSALGKLPGRKNKNGLSAQRINHVMGVLRRVLEDAADRFHFTSPYQRIKPLKLTKSDVEPFTPAEVQQILQTVRKDFQIYLLVRFATGMRTGEIDGLKWRYVDFERRLILVRETVVKGEPDTTKTYESARDIEVTQAVCDALKAHYGATGHLSEYVFCNRDGKPLDHNNFTNRVWYPLLRHLNLRRRRPYQTRHTAATLWLSMGESPEWIARQMGHTTTEMLFRVYSRFRPNLTRKDGAAFEQLLNSILPPSLLNGGPGSIELPDHAPAEPLTV